MCKTFRRARSPGRRRRSAEAVHALAAPESPFAPRRGAHATKRRAHARDPRTLAAKKCARESTRRASPAARALAPTPYVTAGYGETIKMGGTDVHLFFAKVPSSLGIRG